LLVDESVLDFHSNDRGFFPTLVSRNDGVFLLFLLHCFDTLEYLCTVLISLLCSGLCRVRLNVLEHSGSLYYIICLCPDDGLIGAETCSHSDKTNKKTTYTSCVLTVNF